MRAKIAGTAISVFLGGGVLLMSTFAPDALPEFWRIVGFYLGAAFLIIAVAIWLVPKAVDFFKRVRIDPPEGKDITGESMLALAVRVERAPERDNGNAWELYFDVYNGSQRGVCFEKLDGALREPGHTKFRPTLVRDVTIEAGKIGLVGIHQEVEPDTSPPDPEDAGKPPRKKVHVGLNMGDLRVIGHLVADPKSEFDLPLPDHLQFDTENRWSVRSGFLSDFHKTRLDSWP